MIKKLLRAIEYKKFWSWENGQKAYEMMSCYDGLLQLYLITGKKEYLEAVKSAVQSIMDTEINIAGSGSAFECWYHGIKNQTRPTYHTMETCVTTTWMKLCQNLLQVTGDPIFADQIEKSFYNALLASMKYDGSQIAKYSPLAGIRQQGEEQCGMHINCCNANGPRGFVMMPKFALMQSKNTIYLNFYSDMTADLKLPDGQFVKLKQTTSYPDRGFIYIEVSPVKTEMELVLRIPSWSKYNTVEVNDQVTNKIEPGSWYRIKRTWENGGVIRLNLDLHGRLIEQDNHQAIMRGPLLLARDTRFDDGPIDEAAVILHDNGFVNLQWPKEQPPYVWKTFVAQLVTGTDLEGSGREPRDIRFCDFASAGNMWNPKNRYRVWIPKTLNVMKNEYKGY